MMLTRTPMVVAGLLERTRVVVLTGIACSTFACGAPGDDAGEYDLTSPETIGDAEPALREAATRLGLDPTNMKIREDTLLVEGDIILYRDKLLAGKYAPIPRPPSLHDKGYHTALVSQSTVNNIKLQWASGNAFPSEAIRNAVMVAAMWDWSGNNWPTYHSK